MQTVLLFVSPKGRTVLVLYYIVHAHCILRVASASGASCNCVIILLIIVVSHVHGHYFNSHSLKLTVYCEAAKPNSQCLLYCNTSSNQISVNFPFQWYQHHNFRENQVGLVKWVVGVHSHLML